MAGETELTTVYRSADMNAQTDATAIKNLLLKQGIDAVLVDDSTPGVVQGTWEVRVAPVDAPQAEALMAEVNQEDPGAADPSRELDLVTVVSAQGSTAEIEATSIQSILDANGINCVVMGTSTLPNLGYEIRVAKDDVERARQAIDEARAAGPAAAEAEAEAQAQAQAAPPDQNTV